MNILSIDTTLPTGSVAFVENEKISFLKSWNHQRKHISKIFTALTQAIGTSKNRFGKIDLIVFTSGPGSFSGIRINLSLAKALGKTLKNTDIGTISTLEAFSFNFLNSGKPIFTILSGRKNKHYVFCRNREKILFPPQNLTENEILEKLKTFNEECIVTGNYLNNSNLANRLKELPNINTKKCLNSIAISSAFYAKEYGYNRSIEPTYIRQPDAKPQN